MTDRSIKIVRLALAAPFVALGALATVAAFTGTAIGSWDPVQYSRILIVLTIVVASVVPALTLAFLPVDFYRQVVRPWNVVKILVAGAAGYGIFLGVDWFSAWWAANHGGMVVTWFGSPVELLDPKWLKLVCVVPIFYLLRVISLTDLSMTQQVLQSTLRAAIVAAVAIALARPSWVTHDNRVSTVVLVDVSDSVSDAQLDAARSYLGELDKAKRPDDNIQVITFAEKPTVVRENSGAFGIDRHAGGGAGTDIQAAMQLGYGLFPPGFVRRMVILSDGNQTSGDLLTEAYRAQDMEVRVSWKTFPQNATKEIRVVGLTVPDEVKEGQPFEVTGEVWSTHDDDVELTLYHENSLDDPEQKQQVHLHEGVNRVKFKTEVKHDKSATYRLRLTKYGADTEKANNEAVIATPVKGKPHVLYAEGGVLRDPGSAGYLQRALEHEDIDVEVRGPRSLPSTTEELRKYDLVMVSDVPAQFMNPGQMMALDNYVREGGGLIMAGGEDSFGSGGYQGTRIEQIMPVRFDSETTKEQPDIALMLVIDRSGSMQGAKLESAKESARVTAEVLSPTDVLGVIAFDSEAQVFVKPQRASNRMRISADISRLQAGGGTNIYPGLREAFDLLQGINAKVKHVILMTDGEAPYDGISDLVSDMRAARITVSCVGVAGADRNLLSMIADQGDGKLYMTDDIGALPRIFMKDTTESKKSQLIEDAIHVSVAKNVEMIEGTGVEAAPNLHGYVSTKPKPTSEVVLISPTGEPILARWRHGAGWSVAWTSDVKNRWSTDWIRWGGYPKFWGQLVRTTMKRQQWQSYEMFTNVEDGRAKVTVDAIDPNDKFVNELDTDLQVIDPSTNQTTMTVPMEQTAAGRYVADFRIQKYGSFLLKAVHKRSGKQVAETEGSVSLSYPLEYLKTTPDPVPLQHAAMVTGGFDDAPPDKVWDPGEENKAYVQDLWPWVLLAVLGLLILDVYVKRLRLFGYRTIKFE